MSDVHETYGVERACGECGGPTIVAMNHTTNITVPASVQARCRKLTCVWQGPLIVVMPDPGRREPTKPPPPAPKPAPSRAKSSKKPPVPTSGNLF